jgi:hypothetical protein
VSQWRPFFGQSASDEQLPSQKGKQVPATQTRLSLGQSAVWVQWIAISHEPIKHFIPLQSVSVVHCRLEASPQTTWPLVLSQIGYLIWQYCPSGQYGAVFWHIPRWVQVSVHEEQK